MSFGPAPSLVGTLFTNANNSPVFHDPYLGADTCDCTGGDPPGGGGGGCTDSCSCASPPAFNDPGVEGGAGPILRQPVINMPTWTSAGQGRVGAIRPDLVGAVYPPCYDGYRIMGLSPIAPLCQPTPPAGTPPGCVALHSRIALFPEGCVAAGEVQVGDRLLTRHADGTLGSEEVISLRISTQPCVLLETEDGKQLHCSLSHDVMVADPTIPQGKRRQVADLTLQDCLLTEDGTAVALKSMVRQPDGQVILISLTGPEHVYLSEELWSHNEIVIKVPVWPTTN